MTDRTSIDVTGPWQVAAYGGTADQASGPLSDRRVGPPVAHDWIDAFPPRSVHYDLMRAGRLENPFAGVDEAQQATWVSRCDWVYRTTFDVAEPLTMELPEVQLDGVDTYADVWLNDSMLGATANAHRRYSLPIPPGVLIQGTNTLTVHVKSHHRMVAGQLPEARERLAVQDRSDDRLIKSLVRRYQRNSYSSSSLLNLGVHVLGIGINKPVRVVDRAPVRIESTSVVVNEVTGERADLRVRVRISGNAGERHGLRVTLCEPGSSSVAASGEALVATADRCDKGEGGEMSIPLRVDRPQLWWPRGYGKQPLYELRVELLDGHKVVGERRQPAGIRKVAVRRQDDTGRASFFFEVNGVRVLVRGTNVVPIDYLSVHGSVDAYGRLLRLLENGNYNLVRMWGGGAVEDDMFYQRCDEVGIMIWQDLFLHSNTYPDDDPTFVDEFVAESTDVLERLSPHPSLALVCGGNEQWEGWETWNWQNDIDRFYGAALSDDAGREVARRVCPDVPYIHNSPHGRPSAQSPVDGDTHTWGNFVNATKDPQFVTETCWGTESYSRPETLRACMDLHVDDVGDRHWHRSWTALTGRPIVTNFPYSARHEMSTLREYLRSLEVEQACADHAALSMLRLRSSSCSGIVYWSFNKGGPLFAFGAVDYGGYPLMSYYVVKRLFGDVVVGAYRDIDDVRVVVSNATEDRQRLVVAVRHLDVEGRCVDEHVAHVDVAAGETSRVLDLPGAYRSVRDRTREMMHVEASIDGVVVSEDVLLFCPLGDLQAASTAGLSASCTGSTACGWDLVVTADCPLPMLAVESNQKVILDDNYCPVTPGRTRRLHVELLEEVSADPVRLWLENVTTGESIEVVCSADGQLR